MCLLCVSVFEGVLDRKQGYNWLITSASLSTSHFTDTWAHKGNVCVCLRWRWRMLQSLYGHVVRLERVRLLQNESECCYIRGTGRRDRSLALLLEHTLPFEQAGLCVCVCVCVCERGRNDGSKHTHKHTQMPYFSASWGCKDYYAAVCAGASAEAWCERMGIDGQAIVGPSHHVQYYS